MILPLSDDESLYDEDVLEDVKIYSNPLFEFDDDFTSSDVNPLFDEVLEDIKCKVSYDSNLDESTFLVTSLSDSNEDDFSLLEMTLSFYFTMIRLLICYDDAFPFSRGSQYETTSRREMMI
ncbi:hypothetical protein Tco_0017854 [Tanacetum coccineum]